LIYPNHHFNAMNVSTFLLWLLGVCLLGTIATGCCDYTVTSEVPSPDGTLVAVSVVEACGGALGSDWTLVEIRRKGDSWAWHMTSTVLVLGCVGIPKLQWRHNHLSIGLTTALANCVVRKEYEWNGIAVAYDDLGGKPAPLLPPFGL
jgi:hypothetical protein